VGYDKTYDLLCMQSSRTHYLCGINRFSLTLFQLNQINLKLHNKLTIMLGHGRSSHPDTARFVTSGRHVPHSAHGCPPRTPPYAARLLAPRSRPSRAPTCAARSSLLPPFSCPSCAHMHLAPRFSSAPRRPLPLAARAPA
jgi:hypothetical protein